MMKFALVSILVASSAPAALPPYGPPAPGAGLVVHVRDAADHPLPHVLVTYMFNWKGNGGFTDSLGRFSIGEVPTGRREVRVEAPAFQMFSRNIEFMSAISETLAVTLELIPELQGATVRMNRDGSALVTTREGGEYVYVRGGGVWVICRAVSDINVRVDGIK